MKNYIFQIFTIFSIITLSQAFYNNFRLSKKVILKNSKNNELPIPDIQKRHLMNSILLKSVYLSCGSLLGGYLSFFYPVVNSDSSGGLVAKDKDGNDVLLDDWLKNHPYPNRELIQGFKGDPYYIITTDNNNLEKFALNAICTHLGCVVPWNKAEQKFMCPCHGSQYNSEGKVIRGPAPRSLALAKIENNNNKVTLKKWEENDFRDGSKTWWE